MTIEYRVRFSIIINYLSHVLHLMYATLYAVVVARRLSTSEFGLLATIIGLDTLVSSVVYFWSWLNVRFFARGVRDYVESSFTMTIIYLALAPVVMILLGLSVSRSIGWGFGFFIYGSVLAVFDSLYVFLRDVALSIQPYYVGYVNIIRDTFRLVLSITAVYILNVGLSGVLLALISSSIVADALFVAIACKRGVRFRLNLKYLGLVLRNMYIPVVNSMYQLVASSEKPLVTFISSSTELTAYLNVASVPKSVVVYGSGVFTQSLLPKLLSKPSKSDVEDALRIGFLINNGLSTIMLVFANAILSLYGVSYIETRFIFILYVIDSLIYSYALILTSVPLGLERRDLVESGFKLINSYLFKIPLTQFLRSALAIAIGSLGLTLSIRTGLHGPVPLVFFPIGWLIADISFLMVISREAAKCMEIRVPRRELYVTIIASAFSAMTLMGMGSHQLVVRRLIHDTPEIIKLTLMGGAIYVTMCIVLSRYYRELPIRIIGRMVMNTIRKSK